MRTDECPTPKKDVYGTKHQAKTALTRHRHGLGKGLHAYHCPCGYYHLGHKR